jgi:hypothetical protein
MRLSDIDYFEIEINIEQYIINSGQGEKRENWLIVERNYFGVLVSSIKYPSSTHQIPPP